MDSYWIDWWKYGQLMDRMMQGWTFTGYTDSGMDINWIDWRSYGELLDETYALMKSY